MISQITSYPELMEHIANAKKRAQGLHFATNCYPDPKKTSYWIATGLWAEHSASGLLLWRHDQKCWHLYYAGPATAIQRMVQSAQFDTTSQPVVVDIVTKNPDEPILHDLYTTGFRKHTTLTRMIQTTPSNANPVHPPGIRTATQMDQSSIIEIMDAVFDPLAEQIPSPAELDTALRNGKILVNTQAGAILSFLYHEDIPAGSHLRFWATHPRYQGMGAGSALLDTYLSSTPVQKHTLWVIATNETAISSYRKRGYTPDGLLDIVLVRK